MPTALILDDEKNIRATLSRTLKLEGYATLEAAYLVKFPEAAPLFGFADFSLVALVPTSARLVAGFARATTVSADTLQAALADHTDA